MCFSTPKFNTPKPITPRIAAHEDENIENAAWDARKKAAKHSSFIKSLLGGNDASLGETYKKKLGS